ncbi:MAG: hypothetical protein AVDCRST_MAG96-548 [uncultured Segetibacter sp.]|uniref:Uncharacterized protein n=1 Tax=uncultured Segetibacter sp. TaxID=481133 RepID=A0A6J4RGT4_9BACT|nr:MAG: hypothetical protein AVDCRST_MAG96-548 [uncultured Segetibacter sp.]
MVLLKALLAIISTYSTLKLNKIQLQTCNFYSLGAEEVVDQALSTTTLRTTQTSIQETDEHANIMAYSNYAPL